MNTTALITALCAALAFLGVAFIILLVKYWYRGFQLKKLADVAEKFLETTETRLSIDENQIRRLHADIRYAQKAPKIVSVSNTATDNGTQAILSISYSPQAKSFQLILKRVPHGITLPFGQLPEGVEVCECDATLIVNFSDVASLQAWINTMTLAIADAVALKKPADPAPATTESAPATD